VTDEAQRAAAAACGAHAVARVVPLAGGFSSGTYRVERTGGEPLVLRFPGQGAAAVELEAAIAARLDGLVPVPPIVLADGTGEVAGRPFVVTRFVEGEPVDQLLPALPREAQASLGRAVGAVLAPIGRVELSGPGLLDGRLRPIQALFDDPADDLVAYAERVLGPGRVRDELGADAAGAWLARLRDGAPVLRPLRGASHLVHSDYTGKNLLAVSDGPGFRVSAVLDWEFAHSSSPLVDVGNLLRFTEDEHPAFAAGAVEGFVAMGGSLPDGWRQQARLMDAFALLDLLERGRPGVGIHDQVVALVRRRVMGVTFGHLAGR
jgi:fructokinase